MTKYTDKIQKSAPLHYTAAVLETLFCDVLGGFDSPNSYAKSNRPGVLIHEFPTPALGVPTE